MCFQGRGVDSPRLTNIMILPLCSQYGYIIVMHVLTNSILIVPYMGFVLLIIKYVWDLALELLPSFERRPSIKEVRECPWRLHMCISLLAT